MRLEKYVPSFAEVVRANLEWYRGLENADHGDLVIAEGNIISAHNSHVSEQSTS